MKEILIVTALLFVFASLCLGAAGWSLERTQRSHMLQSATQATEQATTACDRDSRMQAAYLHYKAGCYLTALGICSHMSEPAKFECYRRSPHDCEVTATKYKAWLSQGK